MLIMLDVCAPCAILKIGLLRPFIGFGVHSLLDLDVDVDRL